VFSIARPASFIARRRNVHSARLFSINYCDRLSLTKGVVCVGYHCLLGSVDSACFLVRHENGLKVLVKVVGLRSTLSGRGLRAY
jgi:hypothetical protein